MRTIRDRGTLQAVPKPVAPQKREKHLELVRSRPCCVCSSPAPSDAHHYGRRGVGQKADDWQTVPLCRRCHDGWHAQGYCPPYNREETVETFLRAQVALLMEALSLAVDDSTQSCSSCAETARERDEARTQRDEERMLREDAVGRYHLINEAQLQANERVDRIAEAIGCPVHNQHGDDVDREVVVEAARRLVKERDEAKRNAIAWSDERDSMRRERNEARAEVERWRTASCAKAEVKP